jgi:hypothetical protein
MSLRSRAFSTNNVENVIGNPLQGKSGLQKSTGTSNLQRPALGEIKNTRSKSSSDQDARAFKQPLKPGVTRKTKDKENAGPELNAEIEAMEASTETVPQDAGIESIEDIDIEDAGNPQLVVEYVQDIYSYLREMESIQNVQANYLSDQSEITPKMRAVLIDWLIGVHLQFHLLQETLYTTVAIIDRYLQVEVNHGTVTKAKLQLVGVAAMLVAAKYEEIYAPEVMDFVYITDRAFTEKEILRMEVKILCSLQFDLGRPLPLHFLRRASKAGCVEAITHTLAKYIMELSLGSYTMASVPPSQLAAASLALAMRLLEPCSSLGELWTATLAHHTSYTIPELHTNIRQLAALLMTAPQAKLGTVYQKYSNKKFMKIARIPLLEESVLKIISSGGGL